MKAIIIDDSSAARSILSNYMTTYFTQKVEVLAECASGAEGIEAIEKYKPDFIFLDVEMPEMSGFAMLKALGFPNVRFQVVFSTAHSHYAVQAFRFSAVDFLLKPVAINELIEAMMKVESQFLLNQHSIEIEKYKALFENIKKDKSTDDYGNRKIVLPTADGTVFLDSDDIVRLEADGNYTTFHCMNGKNVIVAKQIGDFAEKPFFRVHKSNCINPKHVLKVAKGENMKLFMTDNSEVEVARSKKEEIQKFLKTYFEVK
jgi:two-component system, LytTR family, response regulator